MSQRVCLAHMRRAACDALPLFSHGDCYAALQSPLSVVARRQEPHGLAQSGDCHCCFLLCPRSSSEARSGATAPAPKAPARGVPLGPKSMPADEMLLQEWITTELARRGLGEEPAALAGPAEGTRNQPQRDVEALAHPLRLLARCHRHPHAPTMASESSFGSTALLVLPRRRYRFASYDPVDCFRVHEPRSVLRY